MDKYLEQQQLGKGSYGTVFLVCERSNPTRKWCMKKIALKGPGVSAPSSSRQAKSANCVP